MMEYFHAEELPLFPWHASDKPDFVRLVPTEEIAAVASTSSSRATLASRVATPEHTKPYMAHD